MSNLREIRNRITSVSSTQQITSAMKMVSAAKLRRAQDAILQLRPYANKLNEMLMDIIDCLKGDESNVYGRNSPIKKVLLVVITSNRGLCGAFNANVIRKVINIAAEKFPSHMRSGTLDLYIIGKKGGDVLKNRNFNIVKTRNDVYDNLNFESASLIAEEIMQQFVAGEYDHIELIFNQFINAAVQDLVAEQFLPVKIVVSKEMMEKEKLKKYETFADFIFEPSQEDIVRELIPKSLKTQIYKAILDSYASEHGARMTAMHKATDNAADLIRDLTLEYNKARQAAITKEILEIVSGAEALRG